MFVRGDSEINHDLAVLSLLETAQNNNLRFNPDVIQFKTQKYVFYRQLLISDGMNVDPKKVVLSGTWIYQSINGKLRASKAC